MSAAKTGRVRASLGVERNLIVLVAILMTQAALVINDVTINIALPSIERGLRFSAGSVSWIVNSYLLAFTGCLLLGARLSDRYERRVLFQIGLGMFGGGALLAGVAHGQALLLGGRALQGIGGAVAAPAALATLTGVFPDGRGRNRALAAWSAAGGVSGGVGLILGGALTQISWRLDLLLNVPIVVVLIAMAPRFLPPTPALRSTRSFDLAGAVTATAGLVLLVYAITGTATAGWGSAATLERGVAGLVLLGAFVLIERHTQQPLVSLSLFTRSGVRGGNIVNLLVSMSLYTVPTFNSLYLQKVLHISPLQTGLDSLPQAATIILGASLAARLTTRIGFKPTTLLSFLVGAGGLIWYSGISASGSFVGDFLGPSLVVGVAIGGTLASVSVAALAGIPSRDQGIAAGLLSTTHNLGKVLGVAILVAVAARATATAHLAASHVVVLDVGYRDAFLVAAGFGFAGALLTVAVISGRESHRHSIAARGGEPATSV